MRISDWSSDVCSSDLTPRLASGGWPATNRTSPARGASLTGSCEAPNPQPTSSAIFVPFSKRAPVRADPPTSARWSAKCETFSPSPSRKVEHLSTFGRSEEHTSELQSLMCISYAVFCLKKKKKYSDL